MRIPDAFLPALRKKLHEKMKHPKACPICDATSPLALNSRIFTMSEYGDGDHTFPLLVLACETCGHTKFLSAVMLNIINLEGALLHPETGKRIPRWETK